MTMVEGAEPEPEPHEASSILSIGAYDHDEAEPPDLAAAPSRPEGSEAETIELSVGLTIEGEHGFGLDIGEAAVAGPEAEDGLEGAEAATMVQTVVTNVDAGCQAEGLGVKIGMVLIRIGGEDITQCGPEEAVERVYGICDEQQALGVGVPGGDPLEWVFKITDRANERAALEEELEEALEEELAQWVSTQAVCRCV
eukprot:COSAG02_NODE_553_length_20425_cov_17.986372_11_plen_197_part_00